MTGTPCFKRAHLSEVYQLNLTLPGFYGMLCDLERVPSDCNVTFVTSALQYKSNVKLNVKLEVALLTLTLTAPPHRLNIANQISVCECDPWCPGPGSIRSLHSGAYNASSPP